MLAPDPMGKIHDLEPVFVLRAQDLLAPAAIRAWILLAESHDVPAEKLRWAEADARAMEEWKGNKRLPD